jgi:hypothetical protein
MKRGWIILILIPIVAVATVFAWAIDIFTGVIVLSLGILIIIVTAIYLIWKFAKKDKDPLAERLIELGSPSPDTVSDQRQGGGRTKAEPMPGRGILPSPSEPQPIEIEKNEEDEFFVENTDDEISISPPAQSTIPDAEPQAPPAPAPSGIVGTTDRNLIERKEGSKEKAELPHTKTKEAQFTAYYTRQTVANTAYGFYVYAHLPDALISADIQQFAADLGGRIPKPAIAKQTATLKEGATLTAMVQCDALQFNQIGIIKKWQSPFVRFDFRYTAPESLIDEFVEGRIAIMLGMIEIASIDFQTLITAPKTINFINTMPDNPLTQANFEPTNPASMYQKIFISYSRKDTVVAEQYRKAQIMMGNTIFMDTYTIRAGEDWEEALKRFIREADVFQLFWSEYSATSEHVKFEWVYALNECCSETRCVGFIRPAYWKKPLPSPPAELGHLHFAYVPQEEIL